jgi:hypothetical protein
MISTVNRKLQLCKGTIRKICEIAVQLNMNSSYSRLKEYRKMKRISNFPRIQNIFCLTFVTLYLLMWRIWWAPNNSNKEQVGFSSAFKGLLLKVI